ncbi:MAG: winged helix-turn-helix domain-containing protein, partial [Methanoregula sp.]|nr:winged helix-turn-helix domain-containing protein [Methanoregula sp.]
QDMVDIPLDRKDIDVLSSNVRVTILKTIDCRATTVSELAKKLGLAKSTVHEHLIILTENGFVTADDSRKWRTYSLTQKSYRILHPENGYRIMLLLGTSLFTLVTGVCFIFSFVSGYTLQGQSIIHDPIIFILGELLLILTIIFWYIIIKSRSCQKPLC